METSLKHQSAGTSLDHGIRKEKRRGEDQEIAGAGT
jgi:hypothetical protein